MGREYRVLSHLHPVYSKAPRPLLYCEDVEVIGAPFYVMERVEGRDFARHHIKGRSTRARFDAGCSPPLL